MDLRKLMILSALIFSIALSSTLSFAIPGQERMRPADKVKPWFVKGVNESEVLLKPGETAYCNKDFQLQNTSQELAQVQVVMGNGATYYWTRLDPLASKSYSLDAISGYSSPRAAGVDVDEARIINSTMGDANLKVYCK